MSKYKAGVLHGAELEALYNDAKDNQFALPAVKLYWNRHDQWRFRNRQQELTLP
jgi:hypothetical protein